MCIGCRHMLLALLTACRFPPRFFKCFAFPEDTLLGLELSIGLHTAVPLLTQPVAIWVAVLPMPLFTTAGAVSGASHALPLQCVFHRIDYCGWFDPSL